MPEGLGLDALLEAASPRKEAEEICVPLSGPLSRDVVHKTIKSAFVHSEAEQEGAPGTTGPPLWEPSPGRTRRSSSGRAALASSTVGSSWKDEASEDAAVYNKPGGWIEESQKEDVKQQQTTINSLQQENEILRYRVKEVEGSLSKALQNVKTYHQSQQQLFNDFVLLREKYDEAKGHIAEVLWSYLPRESRFCPSLPAIHVGLSEGTARVGPYVIGDKLGEGQFAKVYRCTYEPSTAEPDQANIAQGIDLDTTTEYALKIINKDRVSSLSALKRVDSEIGAQMTLRHRGILQVYHVLNGRQGLYVVMQKGGKDLFDYFDERRERFSHEDCKLLARSVIDAISFCHTQGICHRDLKPENILLNTASIGSRSGAISPSPILEGVGGYANTNSSLFSVKICDFGLCSEFVEGKKLSDFCGSPGFFAPEMLTCPAYDGPAADIWSVGCILLELTIGHEVFCDQWMIAYDYDLLQDPKRFEAKLKECVSSLRKFMLGTLEIEEPLVDFIFSLVSLEPETRLTTSQIVQHPWIAMEDGRSFLTGDLQPPSMLKAGLLSMSSSNRSKSRPARLVLKGQDAATGGGNAASSPSQVNHVAFSMSPAASASAGERTSWSPTPSEFAESGDERSVSPVPIIRSSMSQKARSKLAINQGKQQRALQLPPMTPQTPAVQTSKAVLWEDPELLAKAAEEAVTMMDIRGSLDESQHPATKTLPDVNPPRQSSSSTRPAW